ncbi:globin domain-containing protein [Kitasatospora sp. KL5]|uniref:globin domain-containing protein n=1 Tax=Kitasatospora sp. KL5 TaxID=3425125 RepID=UPI003D6F0734
MRVRSGSGSTGPAAVPGLAPAEPAAPETPAPAAETAETRALPGLPALPPADRDAAGAAPAPEDGPTAAVPLPTGLPALPALPALSAPAAPAAPPGTPGPVPAPPTVPPRIPAPGHPDAAGPGAPAPGTPAPALPRHTAAPARNWTGPGDRWSRAWTAGAPVGAPRPAPLPQTVPPEACLPPTPRDLALVRDSLAVVEPVADQATAHFYAVFFVHHPEVRALFPAAMDVQRDRLFRALLTIARHADDPARLTEYLSGLGRAHRKYGALNAHYAPMGECLVAALAKYSGSRWDAETELAWRRVYGLVSRTMIEAAEDDARSAPAWWRAEVVSNERRGRDVAVLTVRPEQPYPYRAGQYATVETPWWPRVWRPYSLATAPRPDGLLTFHVKSVQAGWVSTALVRRAAPGDVLRLGPAAGGMVVDHGSGADLLCLGGGTGIAPIAALVEEVAEHGPGGRSVEVFYGARSTSELYALEELRGLDRQHPWLKVHPVVSAQDTASGGEVVGELPEVVSRYAPWHGHDAYLGGPAAMVRRAVGVLLRAGIAKERIHHDLAAEQAAG